MTREQFLAIYSLFVPNVGMFEAALTALLDMQARDIRSRALAAGYARGYKDGYDDCAGDEYVQYE